MRGGKREGAGRKREGGTVLVPIRTAPETRQALKDLAASKRGISVGEMLLRLAFDKKYRRSFDD